MSSSGKQVTVRFWPKDLALLDDCVRLTLAIEGHYYSRQQATRSSVIVEAVKRLAAQLKGQADQARAESDAPRGPSDHAIAPSDTPAGPSDTRRSPPVGQRSTPVGRAGATRGGRS